MTPAEEKSLLRRRALAEREKRDQLLVRRLSENIREVISLSPVYREADALFLYAPIRGEVDLTPLCTEAFERGIPVAFPRASAGGEMTFYCMARDDSFDRDTYGIPCPPKGAEVARPTPKTLLLVPMVLGDEEGYRLGYGGGYFDRFLRVFPGVIRGVLPACDLLPHLPREPHDFPLPALITEAGEVFPHFPQKEV